MLAVALEIAVFIVWASWCVPRVWLSFQPPFSQLSFSSQDTDWSYGQHLPYGNGSIVFLDLPEVHGFGLSLFHGPYWTCFFGCVLWSCCYLAPSKVVWVVELCKDRTLLADPCLAKVPQEVCIGVGLC